MSLPVLDLSGTPYEQGLQHGQELKGRIKHNIQVYFERFEHAARLPRHEVLARAAQYEEAIATQITLPDCVVWRRDLALNWLSWWP